MRHVLWISVVIISSIILYFLEKAGLEVKIIYWLLGYVTGQVALIIARGE